MSLLNDERGIFSYSYLLIVVVMGMVTIFVFVSPILQSFVASSYAAMEPTVQNTRDRINDMNDGTYRTTMLEVLDNQEANIGTNVEIFGGFFRFGAILTIIVVLLVLFLAVRENVQVSGGVS